ncbi:GrpB family protein [Georgenia sp. H159]|uniref:GrpB family protein n=1 Tax=Georgenia sp. H159 TaxID=3076115 RepID=UPI002D76D43A|nr:GrpB family protein [Georgenia sp. H159]
MERTQAVSLVPSQDEEWARRFATLASWLGSVVPGARLEHIGSTAVPDLPAKDVVDVLVGVDGPAVAPTARLLAAAGLDLEGELAHHCWLSSPDRHDRAYVVHVVEHGGRAWNRRVAFRDLLRRDDSARRVYLDAKQHAARTTQGWDEYTRSKAVVVAGLLADHSP